MTVSVKTDFTTTDGKTFLHRRTAYQHEFLYQQRAFSEACQEVDDIWNRLKLTAGNFGSDSRITNTIAANLSVFEKATAQIRAAKEALDIAEADLYTYT